MQGDKLWTIGIVNFHTLDFLEYQLEILKENNKNREYDIIIVDNSSEPELEGLRELSHKYRNLKIIDNTKAAEPWLRGSGQHGEGLDIVLENTKTKYLLVHDPDFFWVGDNYLETLEGYLDDGCKCVGAPYRNYGGHDETGGIGAKDFPAAFGAAYKVSEIRNLGFMPAVDKDTYDKSNGTCWLAKDGADVGWKIRDRLSEDTYFSLDQRINENLCYLGSYAFETVPYEYRLNESDKLPIAYHLFRGSFGDDILSLTLHGKISKTESLSDTRRKYGEYFRLMAKANSKSKYYWIRASLMIFARKHKYGFDFVDLILDKIVYQPVVKITQKALIYCEKGLYVVTHPVGFIAGKLNKK